MLLFLAHHFRTPAINNQMLRFLSLSPIPLLVAKATAGTVNENPTNIHTGKIKHYYNKISMHI